MDATKLRPMAGLADWLRAEAARFETMGIARDPAAGPHIATLRAWANEVDDVIPSDAAQAPQPTRYFVYDPENGGLEEYATDQEREKAHAEAIEPYLDDGWSEEVENVVSGVITHVTLKDTIAPNPGHTNCSCDECHAYREAGGTDEWSEICNYHAAPVATDAAAPSSGMERAFSNEAMCRRDEVALLNRHAETPRLLALLGLPLIDAIALYDVRIRLERALAATETDPGEDAYVAQRMSETLAEVYTIIVGDDEQKSDESLNAIERVKKAAQVLRLEVDLYRAQRDEAATLNGTLLREAFEFTCYVAAAFCSDKQRHRDVDGNVYYIQPTTEDWWNGLRDDLEALQPKLKDALRAPQGAAQ